MQGSLERLGSKNYDAYNRDMSEGSSLVSEQISPTINDVDSAILAYVTAQSELRQCGLTDSQIEAQKIQRSEIQVQQTLVDERLVEAARVVEEASEAYQLASNQNNANMSEVLVALERLERETRRLSSLEATSNVIQKDLLGLAESSAQSEQFVRAEEEQRLSITALISQVLIDALERLPNLEEKVMFGRWFRAEFFNPDSGPGIRLGDRWKRAKLDSGKQSEDSSNESASPAAAEVLIGAFQTWKRILRENGRDPFTHFLPNL